MNMIMNYEPNKKLLLEHKITREELVKMSEFCAHMATESDMYSSFNNSNDEEIAYEVQGTGREDETL